MPKAGTRIGVMQGRLVAPEPGHFQSFPRSAWRDEFSHAAAAGIDAIEWIYDVFGAEDNPLASDAGIREMRSLGARTGVAVASLCADYFMDRPLVRARGAERDELTARFGWLVERCREAAIGRIVLPFVDASRMQGEVDERCATSILQAVLPVAESAGVEVHLETALDASAFARFLERLPHPMLKVTYDSGNSASLGYRPSQEFAAYGKRIGSVHIKDRRRGGGSVALGTGDAELTAVFDGLSSLAYAGDFVLQAARGRAGDEVALASRDAAFVRRHLERAACAAAG